MSTNTQLLTEEFVNLINYISRNVNYKNGPKRNKNKSGRLIDNPSSSDTSPINKELSEHLESELISLLDKFDINEEFKLDYNKLLSDIEQHFVRNTRVNFNKVKQLINKINTSHKQPKSILYMLYTLRDNNLNSTADNYESALENMLPEHKHDLSENSQKNKNSTQMDELPPSEYHDLYYSPMDVERIHANGTYSLKASYNINSNHLNEPELVLDLISLLKGGHCKFFKRVNSKYFQNNLNVSSSTEQIVNKICTLANMYHSIKSVKLAKGAVMSSVHDAVLAELDDFAKLLDFLELNFHDQAITLLHLYSLLHKPYQIVKLLYELVKLSEFTVNQLYDCSTRGDSVSRSLFSRLLKKGLASYYETVYRWLYLGELPSPNYDFFVSTQPESKLEAAQTSLNSEEDLIYVNYFKKSKDSKYINPSKQTDAHKLPDDDKHSHNAHDPEDFSKFYFIRSKVYEFFPADLAEAIFEKGKLSHYLKKLERNAPPVGLEAFMAGTCGDAWCLEQSVVYLRERVSQLHYSAQLGAALLEAGLADYMTALCCQFAHVEDCKCLKDCGQVTEKLEFGVKTRYPGPRFPYNIVIDDHAVFETMIRIAAMFRAATNGLNVCHTNYLLLNRANNRVFEFSRVLNKLNFYRAEMGYFLFSVEPFQNAAYFLDVYKCSLPGCKGLESIRRCTRQFTHSLNHRFYSELSGALLHVIDFGNAMLELFKQDMKPLHSLDFRGSEKLIDFIDNELVDFAWSCFKSAEAFRDSVVRLLARFKNLSLLVDFNNYYQYNCKIK